MASNRVQRPSSSSSTSYVQNNRNVRTNSTKNSSLFAITVKYVRCVKLHVFNSLEPFSVRLLVAEEPHYNDRPHHHIYMRTIEKFKLAQIRSMLYRVYDIVEPNVLTELEIERLGVHVGTVLNEKRCIGYATKFDTNPLHLHVDSNLFSYYYNSVEWAENTEEFDIVDPFVLKAPQYVKVLERVHMSIKMKRAHRKVQKLRPYMNMLTLDQQQSWQSRVIAWWNDWVQSSDSSINEHKKPQLYLWGNSNTGKTTFIHNMIRDCINLPENDPAYDEEQYEEQIFRPTPNEYKYAMQEFDAKEHTVCVIDEFDRTEYSVNDMKKLLAGETLVANRKGACSKKIKVKIPVILISNHDAPSEAISADYKGFRERLNIVVADRLVI